MQHAALASLAAALVALLFRRSSWGIRFECASTMSVALQSASVLILCPGVNAQLSRLSHHLTGIWNLEDWIANTLFIGGLAALLSMAMGRFDVTVREFNELVHDNIIVPMTLFVPISLASFIYGGVGVHDSADLFLEDPSKLGPGARWYWTVFFWGCAYLLLRTTYVLWRLRRGQERIAGLYLAGMGTLMLGGVLMVMNPQCGVVSWYLTRAALVVFAVASMWSWHGFKAAQGLEPRLRQDL